MRKRTYITATDGGCRGNPGIGSWAFVVELTDPTGTKFTRGRSGFSALTTNNEMELKALHELLTWAATLKNCEKLVVYTDSAYTLNGYNTWMHSWKKNMWRTSKGSPVKNKELWHDTYHLSKALPFEVELVKVKGHSGHPLNEAADTRCNVEMDEYELNNL